MTGEQMIKELEGKKKHIMKQLPTVKHSALRGYMLADLKKINEDIKVWKVRKKYLS